VVDGVVAPDLVGVEEVGAVDRELLGVDLVEHGLGRVDRRLRPAGLPVEVDAAGGAVEVGRPAVSPD
jgi:hypothetical protein